MRPSRAVSALLVSSLTAVIATGCFGGGSDGSADAPPAATAPVAAAPVAVASVAPGAVVAAGPATPKPVARALAGSNVVVIAFVMKGPADDSAVSAALAEVRADAQSRRGVDFFVYTVGKDRFGDLADLLGVTGTPSVAVIGRDRTLANLWSGLTDAEILRQSISDAGESAAAHPGSVTASTGVATGPAGNPAGIALAKKVNAAYADVPGVALTGSLPLPDGSGAMDVDASMALATGRATSFSGTFGAGDVRFEMTSSAGASAIRTPGAKCWAVLPGAAGDRSAPPEPTITLAPGSRVGAPRSDGARRLLDVSSDGSTVTYVIDAATSRLVEMRTGGGSITVETLEAAPEPDAATPVCDDPTKALEGLPKAFGGTA